MHVSQSGSYHCHRAQHPGWACKDFTSEMQYKHNYRGTKEVHQQETSSLAPNCTATFCIVCQDNVCWYKPTPVCVYRQCTLVFDQSWRLCPTRGEEGIRDALYIHNCDGTYGEKMQPVVFSYPPSCPAGIDQKEGAFALQRGADAVRLAVACRHHISMR